jgi:hypothetical protein
MTLQELRDKAEPILTDFWIALRDKQNAYHAKHGKYFQLLITPETAVVDGVDSDFTKRSPSDEVHTIDVDFAWATKIPFQVEVHEWVRHAESGYLVRIRAILNGEEYRRERHKGGFDTDWYKYINEEI